MIEVKNLVKTFDGFRALDDLTMTVPRGAVYGLVGPNGAGKSTLLRHLTGIYRPDSGTVTVDGEPVFENPAVKRRIAYIHWERYEKLRKAFDLDEKQPIRRFSKGMQKQAAFWLAMSMAPDVLVLDEPVDGLDPVMRRQVWSLVMADVADRGTTVLVSSHNLRELEDVCDHVGILDHGKLLLERSLSDLQENIVKVMIALPEGQALPQDLNILHDQATGRMHTLILRGDADALEAYLAAAQPQYMDVVPLTLEEIFIYELGGVDYEVKNILL